MVANPDGTFSETISQTIINYRDASGAWQPVDLSLAPTGDPTYGLQVRAADARARFATDDADAAAAQLTVDGSTIALRIVGYGHGVGVGDGLDYLGPAGSGTAFVNPTDGGFEFGLTLDNPNQAPLLSVVLDTGGLDASLAGDGSTVLLTVPAAALGGPLAGADAGSVIVGGVSAPQLSDATGAPGPVSVQLSHPATLGANEVELTYSIDTTWLHASNTVFPVRLDPSTCISHQTQSGCTVMDVVGVGSGGSSGVYDWFINANGLQPVGWTVTRVGYDTRSDDGGSYGQLRALYYFPDAALPDGAQVTSANLKLTTGYATTYPSNSVWISSSSYEQMAAYLVTKSWNTDYATTNWSTMSGAYNSSYASATHSFVQADLSPGHHINLDVTDIARAWYTRNPSDWKQPLGFELKLIREASDDGEIDFRKSDTTTAGSAPVLTIDYALPAVQFSFDSALGNTYAPSMMVAGQATNLPIEVHNTSGITYNSTASPSDGWFYEVGYRWFDDSGAVVASGTQLLPADLSAGQTSTLFSLAVNPPATPGAYTLRLDLVHDDSWHGSKLLWASDWADPTLYLARDKRTGTDPASDTRWVGASVIERDDFGVNVTDGSGGIGDIKTVATGDGGSLGINLATRDLTYTGTDGLSFADLMNVGISYGYDRARANACDASAYNGILGACGWYLNYDERITDTGIGTANRTYTYQSASGNTYPVATTGTSQLVSGAPALLERPRITLLDETAPASWVGTPPTYSTTYHNSGSLSWVHLSNTGYATTPLNTIPTYDLKSYPWIHFSVYSPDGESGAAIGFSIRDVNTGVGDYLFYTVGSGVSISSNYITVSLSGSISSWYHTHVDMLSSVLSHLSKFGSGAKSTDTFHVQELSLDGTSQSGVHAYYDAVYAYGDSVTYVSDSTYTSSSLLITTSVDLSQDPFVTWTWQKDGGSSVSVAFQVQDARSNATKTLTYYAGTQPSGLESDCGSGSQVCAIQVSSGVPDQAFTVRRDLLDDARQVLGFFNSTPNGTNPNAAPTGPLPDPVTLTGYTINPVDGNSVHITNFNRSTLSNVAGGLSTTYDFVATYPKDEHRYFNADGLLVAIADRNGNTTTLDWTVSAASATQGQLAYTLTAIHAPSDGAALSGGTARREINLTSTTTGNFTKYVFAESLGSTGSATGRSSSFWVSKPGTSSTGSPQYGPGDLVYVSPARDTSTTCNGSRPTGCAEFQYTNTTNHSIGQVRDPRWIGATSGAGDDRFFVNYSGSDPVSISDRSHNNAEILTVVNYADGSGGSFRRVVYQDAAARASNTAITEDLTPDGSVVNTYVRLTCVGSCVYPSNAPSVDATKLASTRTFDGLARTTTLTTYRCPGFAFVISGCTGSSALYTRVTKTAYAAAKVDNLPDPLAASEILSSQSPDQYLAGLEAGDATLYSTSYVYNDHHEVTDTITPVYDRLGNVVNHDVHVTYDTAGNPVQTDDATFVTNPGFENGGTGWKNYGSGSETIDTAGHSGSHSAKLYNASSGTTYYQSVNLLPGQTFRFQIWAKAASGSTAKVSIIYQASDGSGFHSMNGATLTTTSTSWTELASDITIPVDGTGNIHIDLNTTAGQTAWFDDLALFTTWSQTAYNANGTVADQYSLDSTTPSGTLRTHLAYAASSTVPAIYPTTSTANYVDGVYSSSKPDEDVSSTTVYDRWGRPVSTTDPDGVTSTTTYAANQTDIASTTDALGNSTTFTYDAVGNQLTSTTPMGETTTTTYDALNHPVTVTDPTGVVTSSTFNDYGQLTSAVANSGGGTASASNDAQITTTKAYDAWGNVIASVADSGFTNAETDTTYDLLGNAIATTTDTGNNLLNAGFEAATTATDWTINSNWSVRTDGNSTYVHSGSNSLKALEPSSNPTVTYGQSNRFPASGGATYTAKAWVTGYYTNASSANVYVRMRFFKTTGTYTDTAASVTTVGSTQSWQQIGGTVTAPAGTVEAMVFFALDSSNPTANDRAYFDDVSVVQNQVTTQHFDAYQSRTQTKSSGTRGPVPAEAAPAPICPGTSATYCNTVSALDMNGHVVSTTDAYGTVTVVDRDLAGKTVQTVANYQSGVSGHGANNDVNVATSTMYDIRGLAARVFDAVGRSTQTTYDHLGRATLVEALDATGTAQSAAKTVYLPSGRVDRTSDARAPGTADSGYTWTKTLYDADGRPQTTLANADATSSNFHYYLDSFETGASGWTSSASGYFTAAASAGIATDSDFATTGAKSGSGRLRVQTHASNGYDGTWTDLSGQTFLAGHTYHVHADLIGWSGHTLYAFFGVDASGASYAGSGPITTTGQWQTVDFGWTPTSNVSSNVHLAFRQDTAGTIQFYLDNVQIYQPSSAPGTIHDVPTTVVRDADGRTVETVAPPTSPGGAPHISATAFDAVGRTTMSVANATTTYSHRIMAYASANGLVSYWPLDERGGTSVADVSGAHNGTASGGVQPGVAGALDEARSAARFDGSGAISVTNNGALDMSGSWSVEFWMESDVRLDGTSPAAWYGGVEKPSSFQVGWEGWTHGFTVQFWSGGTNHTASAANTPMEPGKWYYVVATWDGTNLDIYVNGSLGSSQNHAGLSPASNTNNISLGSTSGGKLVGSLDEVAIYNSALSPSMIAGNYASGRVGNADEALTSRTTYSPTGRITSASDPSGRVQSRSYDRLGDVTAVTANYTGSPGTSGTDDHDVTTTYAYDTAGDLVGTCPAQQVLANACNPAPFYGQTTAWHYAFDAGGHLAQQIAPRNTVNTQLLDREWLYDAGGRLTSLCDVADGTNGGCAGGYAPSRHTDYTYDGLGRTITTVVYSGGGTGSPQLAWTKAYSVDGLNTSVAFDGTGAGEGTDTLTYTYDALGNPNQEKRGSTVLTDDGYDLGTGRLTSRADSSAGTTTFGYDWAGRQTNVTSPLATNSTTLTYNLDGSLASRSLGNASQTYTYDAVGRQLTATVAGGAASTLGQAYDRVGNVVEYDYDLGSTPGVSSGQSQYFSYDGLNRLVQENLGSSSLPCGSAGSTCYTYDRDGNRLSQNAAGTTTTWTYDRSDQIISTAQSGTNASFGYDAAGNLLTQQLFGTASADTSAPSTPTGASAGSTAYDQVTLTWTASTDNLGVARYLIVRGGSQISEVAGSATSFTDTSVAPSTAYSYTVTAVDAAGNASAPSSAAAVTTPAYTTETTFGPTADAYVSSSHGQTNKNYGTDTSLYVDGSHTSYLMFDTSSLPAGTITGATLQAWADASDSAGFSTASSSDTSWTETGITNNNAPAFGSSLGSSGAVSAGAYASADASGGVTGRGPLTLVMTNPSASGTYESRENSHPPQLVVTTAATPPADTSAPSVPTSLGATANGSSEINLAWTTSTDNVAVQGYRVYRDSTLIATTASTSYADTGLASSTTYSYTVAAIDGAGNASAQSTSANASTTGPSAVTTASTYDLGDRTTSVAGAATATFTFDAMGRPASRTVGTTTDSYAYIGSSTTAWQVATGGGATVSAILDAENARLGLASGSTQTWLVDDAHGSPVAGYSASGSAITDALRYTGYGTTLGSYASGSGIVSVWGYQGDLNLSPDAGTQLYANGARLYAPSLGTFTQLDTYLGDTSNPLSLNRYLYGGGNPTSTNDPSGHMLMAGATTDSGGSGATSTILEQSPELVYSSIGYTSPTSNSSAPTPKPSSSGFNLLGAIGAVGGQIVGFGQGVVGGAWEAASGTVSLGWQGGWLIYHSSVAYVTDNAAFNTQWETNRAVWNYTTSHPGAAIHAVWSGISTPIAQNLQSGNMGQALGQGAFDIASLLVPVTKLAKASYLADAGTAAEAATAAEGAAAGAEGATGLSDLGSSIPEVLYHYSSKPPERILREGLQLGRDNRVYLTPAGDLSPVQAQIELALPSGRGYPTSLWSVRSSALRGVGMNLVGPRRVTLFPGGGAGGGWEVIVDQEVGPHLLNRIW